MISSMWEVGSQRVKISWSRRLLSPMDPPPCVSWVGLPGQRYNLACETHTRHIGGTPARHTWISSSDIRRRVVLFGIDWEECFVGVVSKQVDSLCHR
jgi:hypothetical protein